MDLPEPFTYSVHFEAHPLLPHVNTDIGWGCMHRVTQMLLHRALSRSISDGSIQHRDLERLFRDVVGSAFGIQALIGKSLEWGMAGTMQWSPGMASEAICSLVTSKKLSLSIHIFQGGILNKDKIETCSLPFLVLCPLRLGDKTVDTIHETTICTYMNLKSSVGIAGGRRNSGFYFFKMLRNGKMHYLDPHVIRKNDTCIRVEKIMDFKWLDPCMSLAHCITTEEERKEFIDTVDLQEFLFPQRALLTWEKVREVVSNTDMDDEEWEVFT